MVGDEGREAGSVSAYRLADRPDQSGPLARNALRLKVPVNFVLTKSKV
jgi:hypothetical protein